MQGGISSSGKIGPAAELRNALEPSLAFMVGHIFRVHIPPRGRDVLDLFASNPVHAPVARYLAEKTYK